MQFNRSMQILECLLMSRLKLPCTGPVRMILIGGHLSSNLQLPKSLIVLQEAREFQAEYKLTNI